MSTSYTNLLGFALPTSGELDGTWGDVVNASITELVEDAIAGSATASVASGDWTLTTTGSGAANQARSAILIPTGTPGTARSILAPNSSKAYIVNNQSDSTVTVKGATGPTTGAAVAAGTTALVAWNGSDFVLVSQALANATGTLPVSKGGTGTTTLTTNNVLLGNGTSAVQVVAPGTSGNVLTSNGTTWASAAAPSFSQVYPGAGVAVSTGSAWAASITLGSGVSTFLTTPSSANLASAVTDETGSGALVFGTSPTIASPTFNDGYTEEVFAVSGTTPALSPANGSIQTWTLSGNSTPTAGTWNAGQSITLMIDDGSAYTVTWSSLAVTWKTDAGTAPTLNDSGYTVVTLWKVASTIYGARVGDA